jgi:hypothetical protein
MFLHNSLFHSFATRLVDGHVDFRPLGRDIYSRRTNLKSLNFNNSTNCKLTPLNMFVLEKLIVA